MLSLPCFWFPSPKNSRGYASNGIPSDKDSKTMTKFGLTPNLFVRGNLNAR